MNQLSIFKVFHWKPIFITFWVCFLGIITENVAIQAGEAKITGSAGFHIDADNNVKGVVVGIAVGKNDAFSRAFYDPNTNQLSTVSIGSGGLINIMGETSIGIDSIKDTLDSNPSQPQTTSVSDLGQLQINNSSATANIQLNAQ
ncbi:hypothetical protein [Cyanobacterium aponinum]|uniref:hypothetical protein n=1 Tax=Cyanobacterium aponinum TaxID=379064 RepID=UPI000C12DBD0|nr:hypothetical protein [Cyanobacterium aponinum]PHV63915.1 hypothetical protein CSQ80_02500 [Cyanobacterium aponinum IPPAS B-1201]